MIKTAYLRTYMPAERVGSLPPARASKEDPVLRHDGTFLWVESITDDAIFTVWQNEQYACPRSTRLRMIEGILAFIKTYPSMPVVSDDERLELISELADLRASSAISRGYILSSPWHVPLRWFSAFAPADREVYELGAGPSIRYRTSIGEAIDRVHWSASVLATAGFPEQVYCLRLWADENDRTKVMLRNAAGDKAVSMAYSIKELPFFTLWKNPVAGEDGYVTGLEPGTGFPRNRSIERKFGRVPKLAPHQSRSFTIDFALHAGKAQVETAADDITRILAGRNTQFDKTAPVTEEPKPKLSDVINAARTWGPAFTPWHGKAAPDFTLTDITGKKHKLSDYRGKDVLIVFWATWCRPCHMEIPHLIELRKTASEDNLAMLAISNEKPELVKGFVAQAQMNYTVLTDPGTLPSPYNTVNAIPSSFFIDRQGKIKLGTSGLISLEEIKAILQAE
jgi:peroxiredoxin